MAIILWKVVSTCIIDSSVRGGTHVAVVVYYIYNNIVLNVACTHSISAVVTSLQVTQSNTVVSVCLECNCIHGHSSIEHSGSSNQKAAPLPTKLEVTDKGHGDSEWLPHRIPFRAKTTLETTPSPELNAANKSQNFRKKGQ